MLKSKWSRGKRAAFWSVVVLFAAFGMTSCQYCQRPRAVVSIETNESAFLVDMGATDADAVDGELTMMRDIVIQSRWVQTGRFQWQGHHRPAQRVMVVSRQPVEVNWSGQNNVVRAVSRESAGFQVPLIMNASIVNNEDAEIYVRWFRAAIEGEDETAKGVSHWRVRQEALPLDLVLNRHIFPVVNDRLNELFLTVPIVEAEGKRVEFIREAFETAQTAARQFGITIITLAGTDGLVFDDNEFQTAINNLAVLGMQQSVLRQEQLNAQAAQEVALIQARTRQQEASIMATQMNVLRQQQEIENLRLEGVARAEAIRQGRVLPAGTLPPGATTVLITPEGLQMLGHLGR